ncbi:MAG: TonB family protein [Gemmatimonadaceae bacterium]
MRTLHLIESAHAGHSTTGMHSFLSISVHVAIGLTALYATARPAVEREPAPDTRVYFIPEPRPVTAAPPAPATRAQIQKPVAPAAALSKAVPAPVTAPVGLPPVDVPIADPSANVPSQPVAASGEGTVAADPGSVAGRGGPYEVGEVEVPAAALSKSGPDYPERAIRLALSGTVTARFIVGANGRVESDVVILNSTSPDFTSAVRSFLRRARFRPARVGGRPVRQLVEQRFVFELRG